MKTLHCRSTPVHRAGRVLALLFTLLLGAGAGLFAQGQLTVTVLDCKLHGLAVVLQTPGGQTWLVDTGPSPKEDYYSAREVIAPFLQQAVKALAGILISHPHGDHRSGLPYLMGHYRQCRRVKPA